MSEALAPIEKPDFIKGVAFAFLNDRRPDRERERAKP